MSFADFLERKLLDHVFGGVTYAPPATLYIALSTADPGEDGSGLSEPAGQGYARAALANDKTSWTNAGANGLENAVDITFPDPTGPWGTVSHMAVMDSGSGGNMLARAALAEAKTIDASSAPVRFPAGALTVTLD